jgi:phage tail-like protein
MRATGPTFELLDSDYWPSANSLLRDHVIQGESGLKLATGDQPGNPLLLVSADGSLGRLGLPRGVAFAGAHEIYLLGPGEPWIKRFNATTGSFALLPGIGGEGTDARQFKSAVNIAIAGKNLYVADRGNRRVLVFALHSLALRYVWGDLDAADVSSTGGAAHILDSERARVFSHVPGCDHAQLVLHSPEKAGRWSRVLADPQGLLYLFDADHATLSVYDPSGQLRQVVTDAGDVRDRFAPPPVLQDSLGILRLPGGQTFDRWGRPEQVDPTAALGPASYALKGVWVSPPLDSEIYHCPWHRIEVEADLPPGASLAISTTTDSEVRTKEDILATNRQWETGYEMVSPLQQEEGASRPTEFLIQSSEGRYLWLRIELQGDGYTTPIVRLMRVHYPRDSYLKYLPAIYSSDEEGRRFLERLLAVFQTEWDNLEERNDQSAAYFDPKAVPAGPFLDWLAGWLALPVESSWTPQQKRKLLEAAPKLYQRLGTPDGVRDYLRVYLENMGGPLPGDYPIVIEGFRERRQVISLASSPLGRAGSGSPMWSTGVVGRLQLGNFARAGEARLVSAGDPDKDFFQTYAHRFQVFAPAAWVKTAKDERMVRRALDAVKPAHTIYDLHLVGPRFRVGVQSTLGLDTIVGAYPAMRLAGDADSDAAAGLPPSNRLGYDTVLAAGAPDDAGFRLLRHGTRVGVATILR